jgi:hypothetical protein
MNMPWSNEMNSLALLPRVVRLHAVMFNKIVAKSFAIFVVERIAISGLVLLMLLLMMLLLLMMMMCLLLVMILGSALNNNKKDFIVSFNSFS